MADVISQTSTSREPAPRIPQTVDPDRSAHTRAGSIGDAVPVAHAVQSPWRRWQHWVKVGVWGYVAYTGFLVIRVLGDAGFNLSHGRAFNWHSDVLYNALEQYTCALFVPLLFWLVYRFPIDRHTWRRNAPILLVASVACVMVKYLGVYLPLLHLVLPSDNMTWRMALSANTGAVLLDFTSVIVVAHAIEYYRRAQERERIASRLKVQLSEAQLQALRSQLHPHFLFNTLNGVATLMHRDVNAADRMVTDLADLLRATLQHSGIHEISLREELTLLQRYLGIVGIRFRDRLTVSYEIAPEVEDALVPQFLLQPLAENAVEHGIAQLVRPGRIVIRARRTDDDVILTVTDDGPGLRDGPPRGHGLGLANTRARLAELYGTRQRLDLEPASTDGGVRVTVTLPYRRRSAPSWKRPTLESVG